MNMAIDSALLDLAEADGVGLIRLYRWSPPCLSFGRHEPATRRYDRKLIASLGVDTVRRPTGGRAVWHDHELTYAAAAPVGTFGTLRESYSHIHVMLRDALLLLGVDASPAAAPPRSLTLDAGACFDAAAGGELLVNGRKVAGSAQLRTERGLLQHGSLLLLAMPGPLPLVSRTAGTPPSLLEPLGRPVSFADAADAVAHAARRWPGEWHDIDRGDPILERAAPYADAFRSEAWTWCR